MENIHTPTRIVVVQRHGSGEEKIRGIAEFGHDIEIVQVVDIDAPLPHFIDDPEEFVPELMDADIILCFVKHPDIVYHLGAIAQKRHIPLVASGCKSSEAITPFTCCGLGRRDDLGAYGAQFGIPEFRVTMEGDKICEIDVLRGASCGATWRAAAKIVGLGVEEALPTLAREVQYLCVADPSAFDPISGKSSLHYAGDVHKAALKKAVRNLAKSTSQS